MNNTRYVTSLKACDQDNRQKSCSLLHEIDAAELLCRTYGPSASTITVSTFQLLDVPLDGAAHDRPLSQMYPVLYTSPSNVSIERQAIRQAVLDQIYHRSLYITRTLGSPLLIACGQEWCFTRNDGSVLDGTSMRLGQSSIDGIVLLQPRNDCLGTWSVAPVSHEITPEEVSG